jgi:hypothetical protein
MYVYFNPPPPPPLLFCATFPYKDDSKKKGNKLQYGVVNQETTG